STNPPAGMTAGNIYTIAGNGGQGYAGDGGLAINGSVASPARTFVGARGNLHIAGPPPDPVRIFHGTNPDYPRRNIDTFAGNGHVSYADATSATAGQLLHPAGITTNAKGDLVIADTGSTVLRGVPSGFTSLVTVAGKPEDPGFDEDGNP